MAKRLTNSEFRKRVKQKYGNQFTILSAYHGAKFKIKVKCNKCDWHGEIRAGHLLYDNYGPGCPTHGKRQFDSFSFQKAINQKQNNQYTLLSKFVNTKTKVKIKCNKCGKRFYVWPDHLLNERIGKNCRHEIKLNFKQALILLSKVSNKEIKLVHFSGMHSAATFECCKCGNVWRATALNIFNHSTGCPTCSTSSKGEKAVTEYLKQKGYHFEPQFRIETCKDKKTLPFDFAVRNKDNSLNCLIEYQGFQHFVDLSQYKKNYFFSKETVLKTQKHDEMKLTFCKEHGIKLIHIDHPKKTSKYSFIADLVKRTLDKELKVS